MNLFTCTVMLGGDILQQVSEKVVTVPEISILRFLHGDTSVVNIVPIRRAPLNEAEKAMAAAAEHQERDRLRRIYGKNAEEDKLLVDIVFPGAMSKLPTMLSEIGLDADTQAKQLLEKAAAMTEAAQALMREARGEVDDFGAGGNKKKAS